MREWILAYALPIITVITEVDCISKNKIPQAISHVKKEFGGVVYPYSAVEKRYNEKIFEFLTDGLNLD